MRLSTLSLQNAARHFVATAKLPFFITLVLSTAGALIKGDLLKVMIAAINGQIAITLLKLAFPIGLVLLALAFAMRHWPSIFRLLHSSGDVIAGIGFIFAAGAAGFAGGLIGGLTVEVGVGVASAQVIYLVFLFSAICSVLWIAAAAPKHVTPVKQVWGAAAFTAIALFISAIGTTSLYCETWIEVETLKLERNNAICKAFRGAGSQQ